MARKNKKGLRRGVSALPGSVAVRNRELAETARGMAAHICEVFGGHVCQDCGKHVHMHPEGMSATDPAFIKEMWAWGFDHLGDGWYQPNPIAVREVRLDLAVREIPLSGDCDASGKGV